MRRLLIISILFLLLVLAMVTVLPKFLPALYFPPISAPQPTMELTNPPLPTPTLEATSIPDLTPTPTPEPEPTATPTVEPTGVSEVLPFAAQGEAQYGRGAEFHPETGCDWMGVHGRVYGADGLPINGITVHVVGNVNGALVDISGLTGEAEDLYGLGAYELTLSTRAEPGIFWIVLEDASGVEVSERLMFTMMGNCVQTLAIINFHQQSLLIEPYDLPMMGN